MNDRDTFNELRETLSEEAYEEVEDLLRRKTNTSMDELKSKNQARGTDAQRHQKMPFFKERPQILDLTLFAYCLR
ncbi:MAG: hypothetical protein IPN76_19725 [Saprospiraceae bacterium]|nr:hypothetical protein [Saprospiraceae bacterium]